MTRITPPDPAEQTALLIDVAAALSRAALQAVRPAERATYDDLAHQCTALAARIAAAQESVELGQ